ncbi:MAG: tyrosine--tRNA ligase [Gemmatimonadales bacterium]|nr:MAG: tyrosine--tRNA ligase [Gemmatimonadales bacterium]
MSELFQEFRWRGLLADATEGAEAALASAPRSAYVGFDPTASSLHVGHLLPIMGLVHLQRAGHTPVALVGGGTGLIGDPSGKTKERQLLSPAEVEANAEAIRSQLEPFLDFEGVPNPAVVTNNLDWLGGMGVLDFLRDVGKHFPVNVMLRKDTIRRRLEEGSAGITYTEFSYLLLQSYDFLRLHRDMGVHVQLGGRDQWGNITSGIDLIRRVTGEGAWGVVLPLITTSSGVKFGKTEAGAVWLDPERTSPYRFYQFWLNTDDADVGRYLRFFTLLDRERIEELDRVTEDEPHRRVAQKALAEEVTRTVHGDDGLASARRASEVLFGGGLEGLGGREIEDIFADVPSSGRPREEFSGEGVGILDLVATAGLVKSRGEARRTIQQGGLYLNGERVNEIDRKVAEDDAVEGRYLVLRKGRRSHHLLRLTD